MKKLYILKKTIQPMIAICIAFIGLNAQSQQLIFEDFEDVTVGYTLFSISQNISLNEDISESMTQNYFGRINHGVNFNAATRTEFGFSGFQGLSFFGAHDYDGIASLRAPDDGDITTDEATRLASINWANISVNQNAEITVSSLIAEGNSGNNEEDWDFNPNDTQVRFEYSFNNTNWLPIFYIVAEDNSAGPGFNSRPLLDSNGDGIADSPAVEIDETFRNFEGTFNTGSNTSVSIRIYIQHLTAGDEDVAFDDFTVTQAVANNPPTANCAAPFTVNLDANGNASITAADINNGSTDDMGIASTSIDVSSFNCSNIGANTVILTVEDTNGATDTCSTVVTVQDVTAPTVVTRNITVQLDASGNATITEDAVNNGSSDACGGLAFDTNITSFDCGDTGANPVILTVTDTNGQFDTGTATVTVQDITDPNCITKDITVELDMTGNASIVGADVDDGSNDSCGIDNIAVFPNTFTESNIGANSVTVIVTDNNNNTTVCSAVVTVIANTLSTNDTELNLFRISPNPFKDKISIDIPNKYVGNEFHITIYDLNGRAVFQNINVVSGGRINIDGLESLEQALYLVKIQNIDSGDTINKRLIKN